MVAPRLTIVRSAWWRAFLCALLASGAGASSNSVAVAQQFKLPLVQDQPPAPTQHAPAVAPSPSFQSSGDWEKLPRMQIERQFAGPLRDTVIQRLRDPVDGTICYVYLPISVAHSPTQNSGFVQYGGNVVGAMNCFPASHVASRKPAPPQPVR